MVNPIASVEARMRDGSVIAYRDADPSHVREGRFRLILDAGPLFFRVVTADGSEFAVDLVTGTLTAGAEHYAPTGIDTPFRLIYYKRMWGQAGSHGAISSGGMEYFVVGWQTTTDKGRNLRLGLKVFPDQMRYEVTSDF